MTKGEFAENLSQLPKGIQDEIVAKIRRGEAEEESFDYTRRSQT